MSRGQKTIDAVSISRIFLDLNNPRHVPFTSEAKAIEFLCEKENIFALAKDIVENGLNPLEKFALIPVDKRRGAEQHAYRVAEGNRRICALKLLVDSELAPPNLRKAFEKLSEGWVPIKSIPAAIFDDFESVRIWLDRIHSGLQGGIGRKDWNSEQKTRFNGDNKNKEAQELLDYAVQEKMLSVDERERKLTTVQRFLGNDVFREAIGIDQFRADRIQRTRPKKDFDLVLKRFIRDLVDGEKVTSRMNRPDIIGYARSIGALPGLTPSRVESEPIGGGGVPLRTPAARKKTPQRPGRVAHVDYNSGIGEALAELNNGKLSSLYYSITAIDLDPHTPIVAVGAWAFLETLSACAGRADGVSFDAFFSKERVKSYGLSSDWSELRAAMVRTREYGNTTKHHSVAATFNGDQLNNDLVTMSALILACIQEATNRPK